MWNIINSIHSIRTYIITTISLFPTCLLIYHSFIFIGSLQSVSPLSSSWAQWNVTRRAGIHLAGLITCSAISFPVAALISTKNSLKLCPSFNLEALERELLNVIWPYRRSFIICPGAYNPIYSLSNPSCIKLHCILQSDSMDLSGYNFVPWNQSAPPSASHLCRQCAVDCWMSGHCCRSALDKSQRWKLSFATLGG